MFQWMRPSHVDVLKAERADRHHQWHFDWLFNRRTLLRDPRSGNSGGQVQNGFRQSIVKKPPLRGILFGENIYQHYRYSTEQSQGEYVIKDAFFATSQLREMVCKTREHFPTVFQPYTQFC
ncbi:hypothetical protein WR25_20727 [Diploscapter pachys]|uniref:Uncharacterized protein n=1 Tax=Diploscapter pachys TaxID=2018661 RepID=A0A2A2KNV7_9BILA|nr:hypothetical protein WR25_20727 [Diploscapter pachys]